MEIFICWNFSINDDLQMPDSLELMGQKSQPGSNFADDR